MDISKLKEKLDEAEYVALETHVNDLIGQRDTARAESISGRKSLKAEVETLRGFRDKVVDRLGLDTPEAFDDLPDPRAATDAAKVLEARVKRLEGELEVSRKSYSDLDGKHKAAALDANLARAIGGFEFIDSDLVASFVKNRTKFVEDMPVYVTDDGKEIPLDEGVKLVAATKPHLLKAAGAGGSGFKPGGVKDAKKSFAEMTLTERGDLYRENPETYRQLKQGA